MSYQVLARKWRPAKFAELVGQEHVKSAIINGLTQQRTHHAYLFSGTRGVGKTTIARIFAKSLNCEEGISAEPCGKCSVCQDVTEGRFVDLIEIDAASRTKVGDTREILDNVQYAPTRGRYKIYLIDEVHMLSRHSFNALLKTLEEPPEHVKFLFATTDPQKLPVTILSRCLQFNLQALSVVQIRHQLEHILTAENIPYQTSALELLARYARGSMRDALSLTDQAIAQSDANITAELVQAMLGTVNQAWSQQVLAAIVNHDNDALAEQFQRLAEQAPDIGKLFDDLILLCHQVAMTQALPAAANLNEEHKPFIESLAKQLSPAEVQVYYQILLQGKKELPYSTDAHTAFEMSCLRLGAFRPAVFEPVTSQISPAEPRQKIQAPEVLPPEQNEKKNLDEVVATPEPTPSETIDSPIEELDNPDGDFEAAPTPAPVAADHYESSNNADMDSQSTFDPNYEALAESDSFHADNFQEASQQAAPLTAEANQTDDSNAEASDAEPNQQDGNTNPGHAEPVSPLQDDIESNPVLAILANRGMAPNQATAKLAQTDSTHESTQDLQSDLRSKNAATPEQEIQTEPESEPEPISEPELLDPQSDEVRYAHQVDRWAAMIERSGLLGLGRQLALNCEVVLEGNRIEMFVRQQFAHLLNEKSEQELREVVSRMAPATEFIIDTSELTQAAPSDIQQNINQNRQERAEQSINEDPLVMALTTNFDAKIIENSIKPL